MTATRLLRIGMAVLLAGWFGLRLAGPPAVAAASAPSAPAAPAAPATPVADPAADRATLAHANELYRQKKYGEAFDAYRSLLDHVRGAGLYFNASDAAYRSGKLGQAILLCERARALSPRDPDVLANLRFLRSRLSDKLPSVEPDLVTRVANWVLDNLSPDPLARWVSWLVWLACLAALVALFLPARTPRLSATLAAGVLAVLALSTGSLLAFKAYELESHPQAVVLVPEVVALSGPSTDEVKRFTLHEGTTVLLVRESDGWAQIALPNGEAAWLPRTAILVI